MNTAVMFSLKMAQRSNVLYFIVVKMSIKLPIRRRFKFYGIAT